MIVFLRMKKVLCMFVLIGLLCTTYPQTALAQETDEEFLDIISIGITMNNGPTKGETVEFDVSFQSGNLISLVVLGGGVGVVGDLKVGTILNDVQFFSPIAILNGKCLIAAKKKIEAGPKHGDYSVDIRIKSA